MVGTDANSDTQKYFSHDPIYRQDLQTLATVNDLNPGWCESRDCNDMHDGPAGVGRGQISGPSMYGSEGS